VAYDDPTIYSLRQEAMPADPRTNRRPRPAPPVWLVLGFAAACRRTTDAGDEEPAPAAVTCQPAVTPGLTALVAQRRDSP
jgi:hypothetical protein